MSDNDKNVPVTFTGNEIRGAHLVFSKEEISRFLIWNFESGRSLGRKFTFLTPLGQSKFLGVSDLL